MPLRPVIRARNERAKYLAGQFDNCQIPETIRGGDMLPAPSFKELRQNLKRKRTPIIGILFAPPYTKVARDGIVPRLGYLNARTAEYIHFFCAGYGGYGFADDAEPIGEVRYEDGVMIPWGFSQHKFAEFVNDMEAYTSWKYSGETDLILVGPDPDFSDPILYDIEAMMKDGAIDSPARLFEAVISFARSRGPEASTYKLSDKQGVSVFGDAVAESIIGLLPKPFQKLWKRGVHYRVRNLARGAGRGQRRT
jgi:hypothetical protein